jgi:ribosomal-protein-alanine N-acetyltransferase
MLNRLADIGLAIAPAAPADLDEVLAIEALCFNAPWSRAAFESEFRHEFSRFVCARAGGGGGPIAGFAVYWVVEDEVHLINLGVHPAQRRRGVARALVERMLAEGADGGRRIATLEVRTGNEAAIALYHAYGFVPVTIRRNYYVDNGEDALVMMLELTPNR